MRCSVLQLHGNHRIRHLTAPPPPRFVCMGAPLATCALPKGVCYLLTHTQRRRNRMFPCSGCIAPSRLRFLSFFSAKYPGSLGFATRNEVVVVNAYASMFAGVCWGFDRASKEPHKVISQQTVAASSSSTLSYVLG